MSPASAGAPPGAPTTVAWFNCAAGVAGDMLLGALVDAGADRESVADALAGLGVEGYAVTFERVQRCGVGAVWANVVTHDHDHDHHPHRPARDVIDIIERADLHDRVRARAVAAYRALAEVEGAIHGVDPSEVELHEVGALDAIIDVVGVCAALESLGVDRVVCSPIAVGHGTVRAAHGTLPNPVPAVVDLLARAGAPVVGVDTTMELSTPTGVALMTTLAEGFGAMPALETGSVGFGAGTADPDGRPNVVNVIIGTAAAAGGSSGVAGAGRSAHLVEANLDDATGEVLAHTVTAVLAAGAHDAWITPIVMKKGRPAHTVHALCDHPALRDVAETLVAESGTLGLRVSTVERWPQQRTESTVDVHGHPVRVKVTDGRAKVEYDDAATVAAAVGIPLREVLRLAESRAGEVRTEP